VRKFYKTISLLLALSLLQFFVPVLNVAMDLSCCEEQGISGGDMACCGAEFPSRMVCCYGDPAHAFDKSAPAQCTLAKISHFHIDLVAVSQACVASCHFTPPVCTNDDFYSLNPHLTSNQHFKLFATFLI
jgi:hypothetical protein